MFKRKGIQASSNNSQDIQNNSNFDPNFTFEEDLDNNLIRRPRLDSSTETYLQNTVEMDGATGGGPQDPSAADASASLDALTARLENVLTLNHSAFMGELTALKRVLVENIGGNQNIQQHNNNNNQAGTRPIENVHNSSTFHNQSHVSESSRGSSSSITTRIDKWGISYDGSQEVSDFLFQVDTLKGRWNCSDDQVVGSFHTLLKGKADKWFWSYLRQNPRAKYGDLKIALTKQFGKMENDCDRMVKLVQRRQLPKESFDDFFAEMVSMNSRLSQPLSDTKMIELMKDNAGESLGALLFPYDLFGLEHLRDAARKAEKYLSRQNQIRSQRRFISEIDISEREDEVAESECEIAAIKYRNFQNSEGRELDTRKFKCWNCDQIGHSYYDCPSDKRNVFCFRCGEKNVTTPNCKKHTKNSLPSE